MRSRFCRLTLGVMYCYFPQYCADIAVIEPKTKRSHQELIIVVIHAIPLLLQRDYQFYTPKERLLLKSTFVLI